MEKAKKFFNSKKKIGLIKEETPHIKVENLNEDQLNVYNFIVRHFEDKINDPLKLIVTGSGGTGKSFLIHVLRKYFGEKMLVMAPTGVAALNADGTTIHTGLKISLFEKKFDNRGVSTTKQLMQKLIPRHKNVLLDNFVNVQYIIIDEFTMVGQRFLAQINQRLLEIFHWKKKDLLFAGFSIILIGDLSQLPPIYDRPLWYGPGDDAFSKKGAELYKSFTHYADLTIPQRQAGNIENAIFFHTLSNIRNGSPKDVDIFSLNLRCKRFLKPEIVKLFADAVHIFQTNVEVDYHNRQKLIELNTGPRVIAAKNFQPPEFENNSNVHYLFLCKKARVMLTRNIWVEGGLFNGALGYVVDIKDELNGSIVYVKFDHYNGEALPDGSVPIVPIKHFQFNEHKQKYFTYDIVPLKVAYALTVHKCQGLTLPKAVVKIGVADKVSGQAFVALSRVRSIRNLMILDEKIDESRFYVNSNVQVMRINELKRLESMNINKV